RPRGRVPARSVARAPRQGVHPPGAARDRAPRLRPHRRRARVGGAGGRGIRARSRRGPGRLRAERRDGRLAGRRTSPANPGGSRKERAHMSRFYEDFNVGDTFRSRLGRTVTETDNIWFTCLTMNTNQIHFNTPYAERTQFGKPLVNSTFTLALITGLTVPDTSENAAANLQWTDIKLPKPVFAGDTLSAESEILELRQSRSHPSGGIVTMRCRGVNQRREVVIEFKRTFMLYKRDAEEAAATFPGTDSDWSVS